MLRSDFLRPLKSLLLLLIGLAVQLAHAGTVTVVLSDTSAPYQEFSNAFQESLSGSPWAVSALGRHDTIDYGIRHDLIVTVGGEALSHVLARSGKSPILATLLTRATYERILRDTASPRQSSVIFLDQPPARQATFVKQFLPDLKRLGMFSLPGSTASFLPLRNALNATSVDLELEEISTDAQLTPSLGQLLTRTDALLVHPDSKIYTRDNLRPLLITALRYRKPVIGYSLAMVNAGALAALYSTPTQIAQQAGTLILTQGVRFQPAYFPSTYTISSNRSVADALGIELRAENTLRRLIDQRGNAQ